MILNKFNLSFYFMLFLILSIVFFLLSLNLIILEFTILLELNLFPINSTCVLMTILLDWMSLLFMSFVLFISSLVFLL